MALRIAPVYRWPDGSFLGRPVDSSSWVLFSRKAAATMGGVSYPIGTTGSIRQERWEKTFVLILFTAEGKPVAFAYFYTGDLPRTQLFSLSATRFLETARRSFLSQVLVPHLQTGILGVNPLISSGQGVPDWMRVMAKNPDLPVGHPLQDIEPYRLLGLLPPWLESTPTFLAWWSEIDGQERLIP